MPIRESNHESNVRSTGHRSWLIQAGMAGLLFASWGPPAAATEIDKISRCAGEALVTPDSKFPGMNHGMLISGIATDFVFDPMGQLVERADGTATLTGEMASRGKPELRFRVAVDFSGAILPGAPNNPPAGSPKKELIASAYVGGGGPVDPATWTYYETMNGRLTGLESLAGAQVDITRVGPAFQVGAGASGKNTNLGASGWFDAVAVAQPIDGPTLPLTTSGDFNLDLDNSCGLCPREAVSPLVNAGPGHAIIIQELGTFHFDAPARFIEDADGNARILGRVARDGAPDEGFFVHFALTSRVDPGDAAYPPANSPKLELPAGSYDVAGGAIDPSSWHYYEVLNGSLIGRDQFAGLEIAVTRLGPAPQVGFGASGKNERYGTSGWLAMKTVTQPSGKRPFPQFLSGDMNLDLDERCPEWVFPAASDATSQSTSHHAMTLPGIGTDFVTVIAGSLTEEPDGTARLVGVIARESDPTQRFQLEMNLSNRVDPGAASYPPAASPKLELQPSAYVSQGGPIDPSTWHYYIDVTGSLTGIDAYEGAFLTLERIGPALQVGEGASGKNANYGAAVWLKATTVTQPLSGVIFPSVVSGDSNLDLRTECPAAAAGQLAEPYGHACPGSGNHFPTLDLLGAPMSGEPVMLRIEQGIGGGLAFLAVGRSDASIPITNGCFVNVAPVLTIAGPYPLDGAGAGAGSLLLPTTVPAAAATVRMEAYIVDAGSLAGIAKTNGLTVVIP